MDSERLSSRSSFHIFIKNLDENNNILGLDTSELRFRGVQKLVLVLETRPRTEQFKSHVVTTLEQENGFFFLSFLKKIGRHNFCGAWF